MQIFIDSADISGVNFGYNDRGQLEGLVDTTGTELAREVVDANVLTYDFGFKLGSIEEII